jgi:hypothetical protein
MYISSSLSTWHKMRGQELSKGFEAEFKLQCEVNLPKFLSQDFSERW